MKLVVPLIGLAILSLESPAAAQCMDANGVGATVAGELSQQMFSDASGRPEQEFILILPAPTCLRGQDEFANVETARTVHLVADDESVKAAFRDLLGKTVLVRGRPFGAITVHHHAPIVMGVREIEAQEVTQPHPGSALRGELLDTARPLFERGTNGPAEFVVRRLNVIGEWAYGEVEAQRPGGKAIDWKETRYAEDFEAGMFDPAASDFLLRRAASGWTVVEFALGPTDVVWESWRLDHQLPLALFQW